MDLSFDWRWRIIKKIYKDTWNKVRNSLKKEYDSKHIYNKKFRKTKIKSYGDEATDFRSKAISKGGSNYTCLTVILIDFVLKKDRELLSASISKRM